MSIFKSSTAAPSREERSQAAREKADEALQTFFVAADALDEAAADQHLIADEAAAEVARLQELELVARRRGNRHSTQAGKIRGLLNGDAA